MVFNVVSPRNALARVIAPLPPILLPAKSKDSTRVLRRNEEANATS